MDRNSVFFDFDDRWIVHHDDALIAIDKPEGVPSQAADPERPDDLVTRLRRHLAGQGKDDYLGTHQRLDRDTSGVLVYARDRAMNAALAAQFEKRLVKKTYVAVVADLAIKGNAITLDDWLAPGDGGRMIVAPKARKGAQRARTHVRVIERAKGRALLELDLETGRTHQARVQLAHAGNPIAGDVMYGGAPAARLMLHAAAITLKHPRSGKSVTYRAPLPSEISDWLRAGEAGERVYDDAHALERALRRAVLKRYGLGRSEGARRTNAFRLVNEEGDGLPRLAIDAYDAHVVLSFYGEDGPWADRARRDRVLDRVHALGFDGTYLKVRPKQANTLVDTRRDELAPSRPVRGEAAADEISIVEEGVTYLARLGDGLSTGIFLDQRANRVRVRELAKGASVLNLFAYTCAFSIAAAMGGAKRTVSVDASAVALERGRAGFAAIGRAADVEKGVHTFVADDAFAYLARAAHKKERFDLVILDPPSYSTAKQRRFVADADYAELAALALALVAKGGRLLACTNHRGIKKERFRRALFEAVRKAGRTAKQIKDLPDPSDFPTAPGASSHLKSVLVTLDL